MTTREDLIRQRDAIDAQLAKLDATPWEERCEHFVAPPLPVSFDDDDLLLDGEEAYLVGTEKDHVAHVYNAHVQLIACVRALRALLYVLQTHWGGRPMVACDAIETVTKALEELDAL